jgi:hypothetical protein
MALDAGEDPPEPEWLDRPAVSQISISTPGYWRLFARWNAGKSFAEGIKPFGFMLVAYVDPTKNVQDVGRLVHPYERDPKQWLKTEWADLYEPDRTFKIVVRRPGQVTDRPGVVYVRTYRDVLLSYLGHPEAKSMGSDGEPCRRSTRGLLWRRPVEAISIAHIGKEGNQLEERLAGLVTEGEVLQQLGTDRSWDLLRRALATFPPVEVRAVAGIATSTLKDILSGRTVPQSRHQRRLRAAAATLVDERLRSWGLEPDPDVLASVVVYLEEFDARIASTAEDYYAALARLADLKDEQPGVVGRIAARSGVSRRRLASRKDPELQQAVVRAIADEGHLPLNRQSINRGAAT